MKGQAQHYGTEKIRKSLQTGLTFACCVLWSSVQCSVLQQKSCFLTESSFLFSCLNFCYSLELNLVSLFSLR